MDPTRPLTWTTHEVQMSEAHARGLPWDEDQKRICVHSCVCVGMGGYSCLRVFVERGGVDYQ